MEMRRARLPDNAWAEKGGSIEDGTADLGNFIAFSPMQLLGEAQQK